MPCSGAGVASASGVGTLDPLASCFLLAGYFLLVVEGVSGFAGSGVVAVDPLAGCFLLAGEGVGAGVGLVPCSFA